MYIHFLVLENEELYLKHLPSAECYEKSYMHRDIITHIVVSKFVFFELCNITYIFISIHGILILEPNLLRLAAAMVMSNFGRKRKTQSNLLNTSVLI